MSRKYNTENRMWKAYENYVSQFVERKTKLIGRGYMPANTRVLSFNDFVANRQAQRALGVASGNITRTIISQQLYYFTEETAKMMKDLLAEEGINEIDGRKLNVADLRSGLGNAALSRINDRLKARGIDSGYARKKYISYYIFDSQ